MRLPENIYQEDIENRTSLVYRMNQSFYEAYKKEHSNNPFGDTTIDAGTRMVDKMTEEKRKIWEEVITSTDRTQKSCKARIYQEPLQSPHYFNTSRSGQLKPGCTTNTHTGLNLPETLPSTTKQHPATHRQ